MKIGISSGDISGVGIELILKTFTDKKLLSQCTPIVFCNYNIIKSHQKELNINIDINFTKNINFIKKNELNIIQIDNKNIETIIGKPCKNSGLYAYKSLELATKNLKENHIDILVTCPIDKHNIQSKDFNFAGHTKYLENQLEGKSLMFLVNENLKVGVVTGHIPISKITNTITVKLINEKLSSMSLSLKKDFRIKKPKIALLSINPHCGDKGIIGTEDDEILIPLIKAHQSNGNLYEGPFPADSFFGSKMYKNYDAILAMYHDQGLIPFKTLCFNNGVNFTAGLNKIRTSPDHGTAYNIAGKNIANTNSFKEAILTGIEIFKNRLK